MLWSLCPVGCPGRFEASLRAKWFESFEVFLATGKNNLTSLGIRSYSAEKICCAQGHRPWLCGYSVIQQNNHSKAFKALLDAATGVACRDLPDSHWVPSSVCPLLNAVSSALQKPHSLFIHIYACICMQSQRDVSMNQDPYVHI